MSIWNTIASVGGSLLSSALGVGGNIMAGNKAANTTHQENVFWANYNSPVEQMKRLSDAGLNPNLVYQNGSAIAQASPVGDTGAHVQQGISQAADKAAAAAQQVLNLKQAKANIKKTEADAEKSDAEAELAEKKARNEDIMSTIYDSDDYRNQWGDIKELRYAEIQQRASERELNEAKTATERTANNAAIFEYNIRRDFGYDNAFLDNAIKHFNASMLKDRSEVNYEMLQLEMALTRSGIKVNAGRLCEIYSGIQLNNALTKQAGSMSGFIDQQKMTEEQRTDYEQARALWQKNKNYYFEEYGIDIDRYSNSQSVSIFGQGGTTTTSGDFRANALQPTTLRNLDNDIKRLIDHYRK